MKIFTLTNIKTKKGKELGSIFGGHYQEIRGEHSDLEYPYGAKT
jgi:hypothetical protein